MKRGNTALKRGVGLASAFALAIAGAVIAAPAANAATTATNNVRVAPVADAVWLDASGALQSSPSTTVNTYGANSKTSVPVVAPSAFAKVADIQIQISTAWAAADTFTLTLPAGVTFATTPTVQWTKQPVDLTKLANLAGVAGSKSTAAPAATGVVVPDAAAPTSALNSPTNTEAKVTFAAAAPTFTTGSIGASAGYLLTLSNIRVDLGTSTLASQGGKIDVGVTDAGVPATATVTAAYVAPVSVTSEATATRAFDGSVSFPDVVISENVANAFATTGAYTLEVSADKVPTTGTVGFDTTANAVTATLSTGAGVTVTSPITAGATTVTATLAGTDAATTKSTLTLSGIKVTNVPAGAKVTLTLTAPTLAATATGTTFSNVAPLTAPEVTVSTAQATPRIAGSNRYATAAAVAAKFAPAGALNNVILANGENNKDGADALSANFLAGKIGAPVLLTQLDSLPVETQYALLSATNGATGAINLYVLGKTNAVSQAVRDKAVALLKAAGHSTVNVKSVEGDSRYATSAAVVKEAGAAAIGGVSIKAGGSVQPTAFLASGENNADALAAGGASFANRVPVLLTQAGQLSDAVKAAIKDNGISQIIVLGGEGRVSQAVVDSLADLGVTSTVRWAGADRYETAQLIAEWNWTVAGNTATSALLANGTTGWPDALTAGAYAGKNKLPLLTVQQSSLGSYAATFLTAHKTGLTNGVVALGSDKSVADSVITAAEGALK